MNNLYSWKRGGGGSGAGISAQVAGEELERIQQASGGALRPADIVRASRRKTAPLYGVFEWNDHDAGEAWREHQARGLIRRLCIRYVDQPEKEPRRAYISVVPHDDDRPAYLDRLTVLSDAELFAQAEEEALEAIQGWQRRYRELEEDSELLRPVFAAIPSSG